LFIHLDLKRHKHTLKCDTDTLSVLVTGTKQLLLHLHYWTDSKESTPQETVLDAEEPVEPTVEATAKAKYSKHSSVRPFFFSE
jgi:hypothetical protein